MLERWKSDLDRILTAAGRHDPSSIVKEISDLGATMGEDVGEALLDGHPELLKHAPAVTRVFNQMVIDREIAETRRLLQLNLEAPVSFTDVASENSLRLYRRLDEVFDHVDFSNRSRVVIVGCGRRPFTIFRIHDRTDIPDIVGLDILREAIATARKLADRLGYARASFEHHDGCSYDYGEAEIVYVANMASPKAAIVSRIAETAPDDVQLIVREPFSLGRLMAESVERALDPRLEIVARGSGSSYLSRDVFLRRRNGPA